jgi:hypothetical protein
MRTVRSPIVNGVAGAIEIQEAIERAEWAFQQANTAAYASFLRRHPLAGVPPKPVIVQFAWGDRIIPNPATSSMIRAGDLADRTTLFRTDLAFAVNPVPIPAAPNVYPHLFLQIFADPALTAVALQVQGQIASFFALDGPSHVLDPYEASQIVDPDGAGPIFETPIGLPLPSRLNYPLSGSLASAQFTGEAAPLGTEGAGDPALGRVLSAHPVPYRDGRLDVVFALGRVGGATLDIYDLTGRHVRRLVAPGASMDGHHFTWDGRSERGAAVAPGVYLLRAHNGDGRAAEAKVVVVR